MFRIQIDFDAELTKIHSRTLTDAFRHSANGPEFQLWPALSLSCYLVVPLVRAPAAADDNN